MTLVADDLVGWLIGLVAGAGFKKLTTLIRGTDQQRALREAAEAAVERTAEQLAPSGGQQAEQLAGAIGKVFRDSALDVAVGGQTTLLEALQAGIAGKLNEPDITGGGQSSAELQGVQGGVLAEALARHLVEEIMARGTQGGPLAPLANQLNHDVTHLQGQKLEGMLAQLADQVMALAQAGGGMEAPRKPVWLAPRPVFLAGRDELLAELDARLAGGEDAGLRVVALSGLAGAGKTSVALEYAHRHLPEVGLAWQFPAEDPSVMAAEFGELAAQLGVRQLLDARDPVASVRAVLAAYQAQWLLVFDNAPSRASVQAFMPPTGRGRVLITSRDQIWPPGQALEVPVLDQQTAAGFLADRTGDPDGQAALDLADELGGLPLALEQAGAYIQAVGGTLGGYLAVFRNRRAEMLARGEPTGYDGTVASSWALAFDCLQRTAPRAVGLLRLLAFCAPEEIPLRLMLLPRPGLTERLGRKVAPVLAPLLEDELAADDAISALRRYSLVTGVAAGSVSVHRLVQAVTAEQMPKKLRDEWHAAAAAAIKAALPDKPDQVDTWPAFAALLPHAQAALSDDSDCMALIAEYLGSSGNYPAARDLQRSVLDARERAVGPEHPDTLAARHELGRRIGQAGDRAAARNLFAQLLPVDERVLGPEHPHTLATRHELAYWTGQAGDRAAARDLFAELLPVRERVLGPERRDTLETRINLARWTGQAGDKVAARDLFAELLPVVERVLGPEERETLIVWHELARSTGEAGNAAVARDLYAGLVPVNERVYGSEHPRTLAARANDARWIGEAGDAAAARDLFAELLLVDERVLPLEHPHTLTARANVARWTGEAGDPAAARDLFAELLLVDERVLGPEHPYTLEARSHLAYWTRKAGDPSAT